MKEFKVTPINKNLSVRFSNKSVQLPRSTQKKIDAYWDEEIASGKKYKRGEVFTVVQKSVTGNAIDILVEKTDYAHYLYCQNVQNLGGDGVHIIHTAVLVETSDEYYIFGEMGAHTARAGIHQLCGGGIDNDDLRDDHFDFTHNVTKELYEELGIDVSNKSRVIDFGEAFFKEGGPTDKMTVVYRTVLNETKDDFLVKYNQFVDKLRVRNELPEFEKIVALKKDRDKIREFFVQKNVVFDEYMKPLFDHVNSEL